MSAAFQMLCPKYSGLLTPTTHRATLNVFTEWKISIINNQNEFAAYMHYTALHGGNACICFRFVVALFFFSVFMIKAIVTS